MTQFFWVLIFLWQIPHVLIASTCSDVMVNINLERVSGNVVEVNNISIRKPDGKVDEAVLKQLFNDQPQVIVGLDDWGGYIIAGDIRVGFTTYRTESRTRTTYIYNAALKMSMPTTTTETTYFYTHSSEAPKAGAGYFVRLTNLSAEDVAEISEKLRTTLKPLEATNWNYALCYALYQLEQYNGIKIDSENTKCTNDYAFLKKVITTGFIRADGRAVEIEHYVINQPSLAKYYRSKRNWHIAATIGWATLWTTVAGTVAGAVGITGYMIWDILH